MFDPIIDLLREYNWRVGTVYPSPAHIVEAPKASQSTPFHVNQMAMTTTAQMYVQAPDYAFKLNNLYNVGTPIAANLGGGYGSAPTSGIYTGIPSGCTQPGNGNPSGVSGGNPYS